MKIAIIGAGFSGLATAWHLIDQATSPHAITIFDEKGPGGAASGIAAGLLHPYSGLHSKLNRFGHEGIEATKHLLEVASIALEQPVFERQDILRLAVTKELERDYFLSAQKNPQDISWHSIEECQATYSLLASHPGILIRNSYVVHPSLYLEGLLKACLEKGVEFRKERVENFENLHNFDAIILAAGAGNRQFKETNIVSFNIIKGQLLELEWPSFTPPPPYALNSLAYLIYNKKSKSCIAGSTFERNYLSELANEEVAKREILPKVSDLLPFMENAKILNCRAGLRVVTPNHLPLVTQLNKKAWIITGLGSKGLLYHAMYGKKLASLILYQRKK